ncbi:hypothetical protein [Nocardiopsis sp. RV163]|uniref:hypothetical protein n=1 Tax=Nocardiopsis sp. RV163 TaxID=1661388 RepID=UPI001364ACF5|nr:hypothetical protein [Nocardiopsis sp. RV163]
MALTTLFWGLRLESGREVAGAPARLGARAPLAPVSFVLVASRERPGGAEPDRAASDSR